MPLFRLTLNTILAKNTYIVFLLALLLLPLVLPHLTPWEEKPGVFHPAQAQTAWSLLWLISLAWLFYQAAIMGHDGASQGVLEYFKSLGVSKLSQMWQLWANSLLFCGVCLVIVLFISLILAKPDQSEVIGMWVATNLQYAVLYALVVAPLLMFATSLGTRINATAAYVITAGIALYGLYGISYLDFFLSKSRIPVMDAIYVMSPHYHLADLTTRLTFQMGPLEAAAFIKMLLYFLGLGIVIISVSLLLYRESK